MNKTIPQLVGEITSLAALITQNTKHDVFINYQAHVDKLEVRFYEDGWENHKESISSEISLDSYWDTEKTIINNLNKMKQTLLKIGFKSKIDFSVLPYEIQEVKVYRLINIEEDEE